MAERHDFLSPSEKIGTKKVRHLKSDLKVPHLWFMLRDDYESKSFKFIPVVFFSVTVMMEFFANEFRTAF
jgi:hypothetical protein